MSDSGLQAILSAGLGRSSRLARQAGFAVYHAVLDLNYRYELSALTAQTVAGPIRTYELAGTHSEDTLLRALDANAGPAEIIYDVGAYAGEYALALAATQPDRTVVAFEPNPRQCTRFAANRAATAPAGTVHLEAVGLGDKTGTREFYRSSLPKLSSFDRGDATRWGGRVVETQSVSIRRLDELAGTRLPPPAHLKIDAEGYGPAVLRGGRDVIETHHPLLYLEAHDRAGTNRMREIKQFCADLSYTVVERDGVYLGVPPDRPIETVALTP